MKFKIVSRDYASPFIHAMAYCVACTTELAGIIGKNDAPWVFKVQSNQAELGAEEKTAYEWAGVIRNFVSQAKTTLEKLEDKNFFKLVNKESRNSVKELLDYAATMMQENLSKYSNDELASNYEKLFSLWKRMNGWGHVVNLADFEHFMLTNKLIALFDEKIRARGLKFAAADALSSLVMPVEKDAVTRQEEEFFELLAKIQENAACTQLFRHEAKEVLERLPDFPEVANALKRHVELYDWLQFHYDGPTILDKTYFVELLASEVRQGVDGRQKLRELERKEADAREKRAQLAKQLDLSDEEEYWVNVASTFMFLKALRKDAVFQASRCADPLILEIARRLNISPKHVRHMTIEEVKQALSTDSVDKALLEERVDYSIWLVDGGRITVFVGDEAREFSKNFYEEPAGEVNELKGTPACAGSAKGVVKIIKKVDEMYKMQQGDILVSPATNPNIVSAMKKASAIVTDAGGITCHAAIVSREFGVPCVVGTKIATKVFKDGDLVEVDATNGVVKKVK